MALAAAGGCAVWLTGGCFRASLAAATAADPRLAILGGCGFACSLVATGLGWRLAFRALGSGVSGLDACARYAAGPLVNTVSPARLGDGVRLALFGRTLPRRDGLVLSAAGAVAAMALVRALVQILVVGCGAATGAVPLWPVLGLAGAAAAAGVGVLVARRCGSLARLTEATAVVVRRPRLALGLAGWAALAVAGRLVASALVLSALRVPHPLAAAVAITAALEVATAFPITPGSIGVTSGAISLVLAARGVGASTAVGAGLAFHAVETAASLAFAGASFALVASGRPVRVAAAAAAVLAAAAAAVLRVA